MLELKNITRKCKGFALQQISLQIAAGECCALMGRSGSGKTMLLRIIAGIDRHDEGSILLDGKDLSKASIQIRNCLLMHQDNTLFPHLTVKENIAFPLKARRMKTAIIHQQTCEMAEKMGVSHLLSRKPQGLSGGESQRVALARALSVRPSILMLDEPLSSLDMELRDEMISLLFTLKQEGQTIIMVTHQLEEAQSLADTIAVLDNGRLVQAGSTAGLIANPQSRFISRLTGQKNFFQADLIPDDHLPETKTARIQNSDLCFRIGYDGQSVQVNLIIDQELIELFHPEYQQKSTTVIFEGLISGILPRGGKTEITVRNGILLTASIPDHCLTSATPAMGESIRLLIPQNAVRVLER